MRVNLKKEVVYIAEQNWENSKKWPGDYSRILSLQKYELGKYSIVDRSEEVVLGWKTIGEVTVQCAEAKDVEEKKDSLLKKRVKIKETSD